MTEFPVGKVPAEFLAELWQRHASSDPSVIVGPAVGLDVAVLDLGDEYLVAKTDPITFATDHIGWYAVHVNTNDIACSGAEPAWFLATLLLPEASANRQQVETIFDGIREACRAVGASLVGGHSEVTAGLSRPILIGSMLGRVAKERLRTSADAIAGDNVLLTGGIPIEATAILAREFAESLSQVFEADFLERCRQFLFDPGISVLKPARIAADTEGVHAMHDPTEGGLAMGLWELAQASSVDIVVDHDQIPFLPEGEKLCQHFDLDPLAIIASGALLITATEPATGLLRQSLAKVGADCAVIGKVQAGEGEVRMRRDGQVRPLAPPARDELARLLG